MQYQPTPYDLGISDDPEATWPEVQSLAEPAEHTGPYVAPPEHEDGGAMVLADEPEQEADRAEIMSDRYGWAEAEATKPERFRTAQIDEAESDCELEM